MSGGTITGMNALRDKKGRRRLANLGVLAGGLAHEIKNPLSAMSVNLQMMREDLETSEQPRDRRLLRRVDVLEREVRRLESILENFLQYARGTKLRRTLQPINSLLRDIMEFWAHGARDSGIEVELVLASELPDVELDVAAFKQTMLNLLINAQQAIAQRPDGEGRRDQIVVATRAVKGAVEIQVIDSGPGIDQKDLRQIFEPYFSSKSQGSGLGLPTARRIVEELGGTLTVQSEVGRGTSFRILFPMAGSSLGSTQD